MIGLKLAPHAKDYFSKGKSFANEGSSNGKRL
jgi:hypothetical protein